MFHYQFNFERVSLIDLLAVIIIPCSFLFYYSSLLALTGAKLNIYLTIITIVFGVIANHYHFINSARIIYQRIITTLGWFLIGSSYVILYFVITHISKTDPISFFISFTYSLAIFLGINLLITIWIVERQRKAKILEKIRKKNPEFWEKPLKDLKPALSQVFDHLYAIVFFSIGTGILWYILSLMGNDLFTASLGLIIILVFLYYFIKYTLKFYITLIKIVLGVNMSGYTYNDTINVNIDSKIVIKGKTVSISFKAIYTKIFSICIILGLLNFTASHEQTFISTNFVIIFDISYIIFQLLPEKIRHVLIFGVYDLILKILDKVYSNFGLLDEDKTKSNITLLAVFLSALVPGLGQIYAGNRKRGIKIFISSILLFFLIIGIIIWIYGIYDARNAKLYQIQYNDKKQLEQSIRRMLNEIHSK